MERLHRLAEPTINRLSSTTITFECTCTKTSSTAGHTTRRRSCRSASRSARSTEVRSTPMVNRSSAPDCSLGVRMITSGPFASRSRAHSASRMELEVTYWFST